MMALAAPFCFPMFMNYRSLLALASALFLFVGAAAAQTRIGTVDLQKLFEGYWRRKQAEAALKDLSGDLEKQYKTLRDDYKKGSEAYQKLREDANDQAVSPEEREKRKKLAEEKLKDLKDSEETMRQYEIQARTRIEEQRRRMRDKVLEDIRAAINAKAKSAGYTLVIDVSAKNGNSTMELLALVRANQDPIEEFTKTSTVVLYNSGESDLTASVLEQLNAGAPADLATPAEKKDSKPDEKNGKKDAKK